MARLNYPFMVALDTNGDPISGAKMAFFESGTSTPLDSYSEETLTTANANPLIADSAGRFSDVFLKSQDYKITLSDASDVLIDTWDPVGPEAVADFFQDIEGSLASTGSSNAYVVASNQTVTSLAAGIRITFIANHANTGAATLALDGLTATTIKKRHDLDLAPGDIEVDQIIDVSYKATEDVWQMLSPPAVVPTAISTGSAGVTMAAGLTRYLGPSGITVTAGLIGSRSPLAGVISNLYCSSGAAPGAGETFVFTLRVAGSDTSVTATISGGAATTAEDTTNSVAVALGDIIEVKVVTSGSAAVTTHTAAMQFTITT